MLLLCGSVHSACLFFIQHCIIGVLGFYIDTIHSVFNGFITEHCSDVSKLTEPLTNTSFPQ